MGSIAKLNLLVETSKLWINASKRSQVDYLVAGSTLGDLKGRLRLLHADKEIVGAAEG